jgi:hypothetical protein
LDHKIKGEHLHREFLDASSNEQFRRLAIVLAVLIFAYLYYPNKNENEDFSRYWDMKTNLNIYADLVAGGYEFGEQ